MTQGRNRVLVATGDRKRAAIYKDLLIDLDQDAFVSRDGAEAQQITSRDGPPGLLITDVSLPKINGLSLIRQLRREAQQDRMGVIVISEHEQVRELVSQLADTLGISVVLPADADRMTLRNAIRAALPGTSSSIAEAARADATGISIRDDVEDALDLVTFKTARRFGVPICVAYIKLANREYVAAHFSATDAATSLIEPPNMTMLRQIAAAGEPMIVPDTQLDRDLGLGRRQGIRGFAGVPFRFGADGSGTVCLLDTRPLKLERADLATFGDDLGHLVEQRLETVTTRASTPRGWTPDEFQALERLAETDPLTGLANRRGGERNIAGEISRAKRQKTPLSCILLDIDRFKEVNDKHGHQAGDHVLRQISSLLRQTVRSYDTLVRWGGEEFLIVLPGADLDESRRLAERVRHRVQTLEMSGIGPVTISAGTATLDASYDFDHMFARADRRLYEAKSAGRDRIA